MSVLLFCHSEPEFSSLAEVQDAIRGLKFSNSTIPNGILNRAYSIFHRVSYLSSSRYLMRFFKYSTSHQHGGTHTGYPSCKPGGTQQNPRPIDPQVHQTRLAGCLKTSYSLLTGILIEVSRRVFLQDEEFGFRPKHSTVLQLARLIEWVSRTLARTG